MELVGAGAHHIDAGNMGIDIAAHIDALHFRAVNRIVQNLFGGNDAVFQNFLIVVDVMQKGIQGANPLATAIGNGLPFGRGQNAGDGIKRDQALGAVFVAIYGKGNAQSSEQLIGFIVFAMQKFGTDSFKPGLISQVRRTDLIFADPHFIKCHAILTYNSRI